MKGEKKGNSLHVFLSSEEVYALEEGKSVTERLSITTEGAKVSVTSKPIPREDQFPIYRLEQAQTLPLEGTLYTNEGLDIDIPALILHEGRVGQRQLPRENIQGLQEQIDHVIPEGGVIVHLGGAMKVVNIPDYFESIA